MNHFILDIETRIPATEIRAAGLYSVTSGMFVTFYNLSGMLGALSLMEEGDCLWTWNGSRFDVPKIKEIWHLDLEDYLGAKGITHKDGMLLCKLLFPELPSYSLANVAKTFYPFNHDLHKDIVPTDPDEKAAFYNDTDIASIVNYMEQDLKVTWAVVDYLMKSEAYKLTVAKWEHPLKIEQAVAEIVQRQVDIGVEFDIGKAVELKRILVAKKEELEGNLEKELPIARIPESKLHYPPKIQFLKNGNPSLLIQKYCDLYNYKIVKHEGKWCSTSLAIPWIKPLPLTEPLITHSRIQPGETGRLKDYLLDSGWKPTQWNMKKDKESGKYVRSSPLLADKKTREPCPNLTRVGADFIPTLIDWMQVRAKLSILSNEDETTGWIHTCQPSRNFTYVIPSDADTCGTPTSRFKHRGLVNVPRVGSFMGKELRSLFVAREGYKMVGWDAEGLEARMEAHYVYPFDSEYARTIVEGNSEDGTDIHTLNWKTLSLRSRDDAKTFKYAITYGARPAKIASSLGVNLEKATQWYDDFWEYNKGLKDLNDSLENEWASLGKKYLMGLDGRLITTRKAHALLNSKLQGGGAVVMKHAMIIADALIFKKFNREVAHGLIRMHDEEQWEVLEDFADEVGCIGCQSVVQAGEYLKLNVPMAASFKVGNNWSQTH